MAAAKKFEAPKAGPGLDQGKFTELAQRVQKTLTEEVLLAEPKQLDPNLVLASPSEPPWSPIRMCSTSTMES